MLKMNIMANIQAFRERKKILQLHGIYTGTCIEKKIGQCTELKKNVMVPKFWNQCQW